MTTVLITAFEPYDPWDENASWLALVEFTRNLSVEAQVTTRRYPVDFDQLKVRLAEDLQADYDYAIHLGQAPGSGRVQLETIGINIGGMSDQLGDELQELADDGPAAYRTSLPIADWTRMLRSAGIPAEMSFHAGTYLCNATLYWSLHLAKQLGLRTQSAFIHVPLAVSQTISTRQDLSSLSVQDTSRALRLIVERLV